MKYTSKKICKYTLSPRHPVNVKGKTGICQKNKSPSCQNCTVKFRPIYIINIHPINSEKDLKGTFTQVLCGKLVSKPLCIVNLISPSTVRMASDDITNTEEHPASRKQ